MTDNYVLAFVAVLVVVGVAMLGVIWLARAAGRTATNPPNPRNIRRLAWVSIAFGIGGIIYFGVTALAWGETNWFYLMQALLFMLTGWVLLRQQRMVR